NCVIFGISREARSAARRNLYASKDDARVKTLRHLLTHFSWLFTRASWLPMFSHLFTLALLVLADLPVDAAPVLNSDQNRMEETRKEYEEALGLWKATRTGWRRPGRNMRRSLRPTV